MRKRVKVPKDVLAQMKAFYGGLIDFSRVRYWEQGIPSLGSTRAIGTRFLQGIYFQEGAISGGVDEDGRWQKELRYILAHELAHCMQGQRDGWSYMACSLRAQLRSVLETGSRMAAYDYHFPPKGAEEEAQLLGDYFARTVLDWDAPSRLFCLDYPETIDRAEADRRCAAYLASLRR